MDNPHRVPGDSDVRFHVRDIELNHLSPVVSRQEPSPETNDISNDHDTNIFSESFTSAQCQGLAKENECPDSCADNLSDSGDDLFESCTYSSDIPKVAPFMFSQAKSCGMNVLKGSSEYIKKITQHIKQENEESEIDYTSDNDSDMDISVKGKVVKKADNIVGCKTVQLEKCNRVKETDTKQETTNNLSKNETEKCDSDSDDDIPKAKEIWERNVVSVGRYKLVEMISRNTVKEKASINNVVKVESRVVKSKCNEREMKQRQFTCDGIISLEKQGTDLSVAKEDNILSIDNKFREKSIFRHIDTGKEKNFVAYEKDITGRVSADSDVRLHIRDIELNDMNRVVSRQKHNPETNVIWKNLNINEPSDNFTSVQCLSECPNSPDDKLSDSDDSDIPWQAPFKFSRAKISGIDILKGIGEYLKVTTQHIKQENEECEIDYTSDNDSDMDLPVKGKVVKKADNIVGCKTVHLEKCNRVKETGTKQETTDNLLKDQTEKCDRSLALGQFLLNRTGNLKEKTFEVLYRSGSTVTNKGLQPNTSCSTIIPESQLDQSTFFITKPNHFKKAADDTLTQSVVKCLSRYMESVCAILFSGELIGTGFRVGEKYIMTAYHVMSFIFEQHQMATGGLSPPKAYVIFQESPLDRQSVAFEFIAVEYSDVDLDIVVFEVSNPENLPEKLVLAKTECKEPELHVIGYGHQNLKKHVDPKCKVLNPLADRIWKAKEWNKNNETDIEKILRNNNQDISVMKDAYKCLDYRSIIFFSHRKSKFFFQSYAGLKSE
ncbi:uncharacterized protein LOC128547873 [Mercenaria mercenaria]|uniref:uncharacterized protein LOC128547873 n=1 Tax=Mercenaria mercenaria TaxID=6596 RepID=UPI00234F46D9|nr:uncharacterized protein LOC128547873 [Mercenaria mercenaria]XP_053377418.1 uncharacterized protein LOC128547873 [Mercenaria mercenaria]